MLQTQVNYWTLLENQRSHLANEAIQWAQTGETQRHNLESERLGFETLSESSRHNVASEVLSSVSNQISRDTLQETQRSNIRREQQNTRRLNQQQKERAETIRHNKATERIQKSNVEFNYANMAQNRELGFANVGLSRELGYANVGLGYSQLGETTRSHMANEDLTGYSNQTQRVTAVSNARTNATNAQTNKDKLAWEQEKYKEFEYPWKQKELTKSYVDSGLGFVESIMRNAVDIYSSSRGAKARETVGILGFIGKQAAKLSK